MNHVPAFKVITCGDTEVGKTSIIRRCIYNTFEENKIQTLGMDYNLYDIELENGVKIKLGLVDTAGQERFKCLGKGYFRNADGVLFVFSHNNKESFENLTSWIKIFEECNKKTGTNIPKYLIGNKNDLEKEVDEEEIEKFKKEYPTFKYKSTSAKKDENKIKELFQELGEDIYQANKDNLNKENKSIKLSRHNDKKFGEILANCCL